MKNKFRSSVDTRPSSCEKGSGEKVSFRDALQLKTFDLHNFLDWLGLVGELLVREGGKQAEDGAGVLRPERYIRFILRITDSCENNLFISGSHS